MTIQDLIDEAAALAHPYANPPLPLAYLLKVYQNVEEEVLLLYLNSAPEYLSAPTAYPITITSTGNTTGYQLAAPPPGSTVKTDGSGNPVFTDFGGTVVLVVNGQDVPGPEPLGFYDFVLTTTEGRKLPLRLTPERLQDTPATHPSGFLRGNLFFPCDPLERRWEGSDQRPFFRPGETLTYRYVARRLPADQPTAEARIPAGARQYVVATLAFYLLLTSQLQVPEARLLKAQQAVGQGLDAIFLGIGGRSPKTLRKE